MNRRDLLQKIMMTVGASLAFPSIAKAVPIRSTLVDILTPGPMTISDIMRVSYKPVLDVMRQGTKWVTHDLRMLEREGRIEVRSLGACIVAPQSDGTTKHYEPMPLTIPMVWLQSDEDKADTPNKKIELVQQLLENTFNSLDDYLIEKMGTGKAIVSKEYQYDCTEIMQMPYENSYCYVMKIYTGVVFIN